MHTVPIYYRRPLDLTNYLSPLSASHPRQISPLLYYYLDHLIDDSPGSLCNYSGMDKRDARLPGL